ESAGVWHHGAAFHHDEIPTTEEVSRPKTGESYRLCGMTGLWPARLHERNGGILGVRRLDLDRLAVPRCFHFERLHHFSPWVRSTITATARGHAAMRTRVAHASAVGR